MRAMKRFWRSAIVALIVTFPFSFSAELLVFTALGWAPPGSLMASITTTGAGKVPAGGGGGYTGPGDVVSGAKGWWGLRGYTAAIASGGTTAAIKIVRASDSHTCDVLIDSSGGLGNTANCSTGGENGTAVATWCNATTCTINLWYDQTGNGNTFTQATVGKQATLTFSCLGSLPCATFGGGQVYSSSVSSTSLPLSFSAVATRTGATTSENDILVNGEGFFYNNSANQFGAWFGTTQTATASDSAWHALQAKVTATPGSDAIAVDATQTTGLDFGSIPLNANPFLGGSDSTPTKPLNGKLTEVGLWGGTSFTGTQMTNICHNQYTYWGTPTSC